MPSLFTNWLPKKPKPEPVDWEAKFKKAITDLAAAREEIAHLDECEKRLDADRNHWRAEANSLRPDAEAMRRKRERDRNRRKGKVS